MAALEFQDIIYQKHHRVQGAAWVSINRPEVMNSFTGRTLAEMKEAVIAANCDESIGVGGATGVGAAPTAAEKATFAQVGPRVGSPASGHYVSYLIWVVGAKKAKEMWMLCRRYTAEEALELGLVNVVV